MEYKKVTTTFTNGIDLVIKNKILEACDLIEVIINSKPFKEFVINKTYRAEKLSNKDLYQEFLNRGDFHFLFEFHNRIPNHNKGYSVSNDTITNIYGPVMKNDSIPRIAATLLHEYGHTIHFDHSDDFANTLSYHLQFEGEKMIKPIYEKLKKMDYPQKDMWMTYEPVICFLPFWKKIDFKPYNKG